MDSLKTGPDGAPDQIDLDLTDLLGSGQAFAAGADAELQALMIDANCNKMGSEGCTCS